MMILLDSTIKFEDLVHREVKLGPVMMFKRRRSSNCRLTDRSGCSLELLAPRIQFSKAPYAAVSFLKHFLGPSVTSLRCRGEGDGQTWGSSPTETGRPHGTRTPLGNGDTPKEQELAHGRGEAPRNGSSPTKRRRPTKPGAPSGQRPVTPLCLPAPLAGHGPGLPNPLLRLQDRAEGPGPGRSPRLVPRARGGSGGHNRGGPSGPARPLAAPPRSPHAVTGGGGGTPRLTAEAAPPIRSLYLPCPPWRGGGSAAATGSEAGRAGRGGRAIPALAAPTPPAAAPVYCFLPPLRAAAGAAHPFARQRRPISARRREEPANRRRARGQGWERAP